MINVGGNERFIALNRKGSEFKRALISDIHGKPKVLSFYFWLLPAWH